jgi:hypothetical protein
LHDAEQQRENYWIEVERTEIDATFIDEEDEQDSTNAIYSDLRQDVASFTAFCGFSPPDFANLYGPLEDLLSVVHRGRRRVIGPIDSFLLFLHWLRTGNSFAIIASVFHLKPETLRNRVIQVADIIHEPLVARFITSAGSAVFAPSEVLPECGLVVDATVQKRGRPVGAFAESKRYYSGNHHMYCLKSQVITDRHGMAVHIIAGIRGAIHDVRLFRDHIEEIEEFINRHPGEPMKILGDKGYMGESGSNRVMLVVPHRAPRLRQLTQEQQIQNATIGSE